MTEAIFTFTTPANPKVSEVTLDQKTVDRTTAKKAIDIVTDDIIKKLLPILQEQYKASYNELMASKRFNMSFEPPKNQKDLDEKNFEVTIWNKLLKITLPIPEIGQSLQESLATVASPTKASATSPKSLPSAQQPGQPGESTLPSKKTTSASYIPDQQGPLLPVKEIENPTPPVTAPTAENTPPTHNIVYRFFAAIFNWFMSLFSSDTSEKSAQAVSNIRPLINGNNICFINAVFQALMNMPAIIQVLIEAHNKKIKKDDDRLEELLPLIKAVEKDIERIQTDIQNLKTTYPWYAHWLPDPAYDQLIAQIQGPLKNRNDYLKRQIPINNSILASNTLIQALSTYDDRNKDPVWLDALRGFDPIFSGGSQQDASELFYHIFDPLIDRSKLASLGQFIPKFGEEVQLVSYLGENETEIKDLELKVREAKDVSQLPPNGLRRELSPSSIIPFDMPNEGTTLQTLVTRQLHPNDALADEPSVYEVDGVRGSYKDFQKRVVIESLDGIEGNVPEYVTLQLMRFNNDLSKNAKEIVLPEDNQITLVVDEKEVEYEIHTLVMHRGSTPNCGHYFSYVRKDGAWFEANDEKVTRLTELPDSVKTETYMIFLKKV